MNKTTHNSTLALAGIFQACNLVKQIANDGQCAQEAFNHTIGSIFITDPETPEEVYGGLSGVRPGLTTLLAQLDAGTKPDPDIMRYALSIMVLTRRLMKDKKRMPLVIEGIERAKSQAEHFSNTHDNVIANLAGIYVDAVSTLQPRILVNGAHGHLSHANIANKVRALLFAGIRSAVLWRQCGGNRWQLIFKRRMVAREAQRLLSV